jgi:hypothetical protein
MAAAHFRPRIYRPARKQPSSTMLSLEEEANAAQVFLASGDDGCRRLRRTRCCDAGDRHLAVSYQASSKRVTRNSAAAVQDYLSVFSLSERGSYVRPYPTVARMIRPADEWSVSLTAPGNWSATHQKETLRRQEAQRKRSGALLRNRKRPAATSVRSGTSRTG